jgi:hypothetical protein
VSIEFSIMPNSLTYSVACISSSLFIISPLFFESSAIILSSSWTLSSTCTCYAKYASTNSCKDILPFWSLSISMNSSSATLKSCSCYGEPFICYYVYIHVYSYIYVCLPSNVETVLSLQELSSRRGSSPIWRTPRRVSSAPFRIRVP